MNNLIITIYSGVLTVFNTILTVILSPLDALLSAIIPSYDSMSTYVLTFFNYFKDLFQFIIDWIHIPPLAIEFILGYIAFKVVLYFGTLSIKLLLKWYNALKI